MTMDIHQHSLRVDTTITNGQKTVDQFNHNLSPRSPNTPPSSVSPHSNYTSQPSSTLFLETKPKIKRSFDVAFLIQPDDLSKKRQQKMKQNSHAHIIGPLPIHQQQQETLKINGLSVNDAHISNLLLQNAPYFYEHRLSKLEDQPHPYNLVMSEKNHPLNLDSLSVIGSKSAFTKVTQPMNRSDKDSKMFNSPSRSPSSISPSQISGGLSPDHSYQDSLSPPAMIRSPEPPPSFSRQKLSSDFHQASMTPPGLLHFGAPDKVNHERHHYEKLAERSGKIFPDPKSSIIHVESVNGGISGSHGKMSPDKSFPSSKPPSLRLGPTENSIPYPSEAFPYPSLSVPNYPFPQMTPFPRQTSVPMPLLAAATANVALLPSSLAALTLPAQNVCAKCKVSFRMTSDLVYHMRSHHKRESTVVNDSLRKRREEKLKCPVCNESFRERHHLTRHMTAHQDKEGDRIDSEDQEISEITARAGKKHSEKTIVAHLPGQSQGMSNK